MVPESVQRPTAASCDHGCPGVTIPIEMHDGLSRRVDEQVRGWAAADWLADRSIVKPGGLNRRRTDKGVGRQARQPGLATNRQALW